MLESPALIRFDHLNNIWWKVYCNIITGIVTNTKLQPSNNFDKWRC